MYKKIRINRALKWTLMGCLYVIPVAEQNQTGPYRVGHTITDLAAEPYAIHSVFAGFTPEIVACCMVHEGLLTVETKRGKNQITPMLSVSWEASDNGPADRFHLQNANLLDGQTVMPEDLCHTIEEV